MGPRPGDRKTRRRQTRLPPRPQRQFARPEVLRRALRAKGVEIHLEQRPRAESDVAVAAASILARERFVDWLDKTSKGAGVKLPPGASPAVVEAAREIIARHGKDSLAKVAKRSTIMPEDIIQAFKTSGGIEPSAQGIFKALEKMTPEEVGEIALLIAQWVKDNRDGIYP